MSARPFVARTLIALLASAALAASEQPYHEIQGLLDRHCYACHNPDRAESELDLASLSGLAAFREQPALLETMEWVLTEHEMPPRDAEPRMSEADRERLTAWVTGELIRLANIAPHDPGPVVMPRLTAAEYGNVIRDLTGIAFDGGKYLPPDGGAGEGFTNVGAGQAMTTGHLEQFLAAAGAVLDHLRASPEAGLIWYPQRLGPASTPDQFRQDRNREWLRWHHQEERELSGEQLARVERATGLRLGAYLEAAWRYHHRRELGLDGAELADIAADYPVPLSPSVLTAYHRMLDDEPDDGATSFVLNAFRERWRNLPAPIDGRAPAELREELADFEIWYEYWVAGPYQYRRSRIRDHRYQDEPQGRSVFDFSEARGPVRELYLAITDCRDGNADDIVIFRNGAFLFGELQRGRGAERYAETREEAWDRHVGAFEVLVGDGPVRWGVHPDGGDLAADEIAVRAPARLRIEVPEGAVGFMVDVDLERAGATVQWEVTNDLDEITGHEAHDFTTWLPRHHITSFEQDDRKSLDWALKRGADLLPNFNQYRKHYHEFYHGFTAVPLRYLAEEGHKQWADGRHDPFDIRPYDPWERPATAIRAEADAEDRAYFERLRQQVIDGAQMPHQDLAVLLREHGVAEVREGVLPSAEALAALPEAARHEARELIHAVEALEAGFAERAREQLAAFASRAWRRAPTPAEIDQLLALYRESRLQGLSYDASLKQGLKLVLVSPWFVYRPQAARGSQDPYPLTDQQLATRLAFTLWGSLPDEELRELADAGSLQDTAILREQVARMLDDPRAEALAWQFAGEWFNYANFSRHTDPDGELFGDYDEDLRRAMLAEAVTFFDHLFTADRPLTELYAADYVFVNERLAEHYGIDGVEGDEIRQVPTPAGRRGGILGLGAVLTKTSTPLRTSPVLRGAWLLEQVLGEHLPSPPPDVEQLSDGERNEAGETIAEQLARHRDDPACRDCHARIDPLGLAMEHFDAIGRWRDTDRAGDPIDASGSTADGIALAGVAGLRDYLHGERDQILAHFCRKFLGYCLGREVLPSDRPLLEAMQETLAANDYRFEPLVETVVTSRQFRLRRDGE